MPINLRAPTRAECFALGAFAAAIGLTTIRKHSPDMASVSRNSTADTPTDSAPMRRMSYEAYLVERGAKISLGEVQGKFLDQSILTLGGGALGLTLTFLNDHQRMAALPAFSYAGIGLLVLSLICVLFSLYSSQRSISQHIDALDDLCRNDFIEDERHQRLQNNPWTGATLYLNRFAGLSLVAGIISVSIFVACNLPVQPLPTNEKEKAMQNKKSPAPQTGTVVVPLQKGAVITQPPVAQKPANPAGGKK